MADSVKTGLLKAIETKLAAVTGMGSVARWQDDVEVNLEKYALPALFFYEEEEKESYNRLTLGQMDFWLQVFFALDPDNAASYPAFTETAEELSARIDNLFAAPGDLRAAGLIQARPARQVIKGKRNADYGVLFMNYQLTYSHARQDAFSLTV